MVHQIHTLLEHLRLILSLTSLSPSMTTYAALIFFKFHLFKTLGEVSSRMSQLCMHSIVCKYKTTQWTVLWFLESWLEVTCNNSNKSYQCGRQLTHEIDHKMQLTHEIDHKRQLTLEIDHKRQLTHEMKHQRQTGAWHYALPPHWVLDTVHSILCPYMKQTNPTNCHVLSVCTQAANMPGCPRALPTMHKHLRTQVGFTHSF